MKWFNLLLIGLLAFGFTACEKHSASELDPILMHNEPPVKVSQKQGTPESTAPSDTSKPAPGYL
jgi:hypothetical protein